MLKGNQGQLASLLLEDGVVSQELLDRALVRQAETERPLGRILLEEGFVKEADMVRVLARSAGYEFIDLEDYNVDPAAASMISDTLAKRYLIMPVAWDGNRLVVAMSDPSDLLAVDDLRAVTGCELKVVVATSTGLQMAINNYYRHDQLVEDISAEASRDFSADGMEAAVDAIEDAPLVKLLNLMISQAVADRASDIHIEPTQKEVRVRYRIDGVLYEMKPLQKNIQNGVTSRIKIMSDMDISEHRLPQDGRMTIDVGGRIVDLRVVTIPTSFGEKVVMRILDHSKALYKLSDLGFEEDQLRRYEAAYRRSHGTILVTGPTGSGKTTTLYATLNNINEDTKNIVTVEDPVEYRIPGINQVQANFKTGLTFPVALKAMLRADPDIILVGEIRDRDTAKIAVEAALTGHLVLSTIHTNDAVSTPLRLTEMGVDPFLVSSAVTSIVAQRLCRRLCDRCRTPYTLSPGQSPAADALGLFPEGYQDPIEIFKAEGCQVCARTGFQGRFALYEVLTISEEIGQMIVEGEHTEAVRKVAKAQGMQSIQESGMHKVRLGITSVDEVLRAIG